MGVFRFRDRWQQSIRDIWNREDQTDRLMALLEQRDRDLEDWLQTKVIYETCTSTTRPTGVAGKVIFETDTLRTRLYDGTGWLVLDEPWQTWSPTLYQAATVTYTANIMRCRRSGSICDAQMRMTVTGTGTATNPVLINLPYNALNTLVYGAGGGSLYDASVNADWPWMPYIIATNAFAMMNLTGTGGERRLGANGFVAALANNDIVVGSFSYEMDNTARYS